MLLFETVVHIFEHLIAIPCITFTNLRCLALMMSPCIEIISFLYLKALLMFVKGKLNSLAQLWFIIHLTWEENRCLYKHILIFG